MRLDPPSNPSYAAIVTRLPMLIDLVGCDRLRGAPLFGFQAIVGLDNEEGEIGIVFPAECQLSEEFARANNLHRHADRNADKDATGYLEDNRRVRAIKFRGHRSDCLWLPLDSLAHTGAKVDELREGDCFDVLDEHPICTKYVIRTKTPNNMAKREKKFDRVDPRLFPEHSSTPSYWMERDTIAPDQWIWVSQKAHGTSWRGTRTSVLRQLNLRERIARKLGVSVLEHEWAPVAGSRKVIKDSGVAQNHYYDSDIWTQHLLKIEHLIPEGWIVYGELVGWVDEVTPIQVDYTYGQPPGTMALLVYRVATVNTRGVSVDLSWPQVKEFCGTAGLQHVPELWAGYHSGFVAEEWIDRRLADDFPQALPPGSNKKLVDEGVCIRVDRMAPYIAKAKSPIFLMHETKMLDGGVSDIESSESEAVG